MQLVFCLVHGEVILEKTYWQPFGVVGAKCSFLCITKQSLILVSATSSAHVMSPCFTVSSITMCVSAFYKIALVLL